VGVAAADTGAMGSVIRLAAIITSVLVLLGFAFFAVDEMDKGSKTQQTAVSEGTGASASEAVAVAPAPEEESVREKHNSAAREAVDDVNDVLLAPFMDLIDSDDAWVNRAVPALLAVLLYGVGLGFLANLFPKERAHGEDWRAAEY
jgi:predicted lipid-binding transport protein (Tim44 family)